MVANYWSVGVAPPPDRHHVTMVTATAADVDATTTTAYNHNVTAQLPCCDHVPLIVYLLQRQQVVLFVYTNYYYYYNTLANCVCTRSTAAATAAVVRVYLTRGVQ